MDGTDLVMSAEDVDSLSEKCLGVLKSVREELGTKATDATIMAIARNYECEVLAHHVIVNGPGARQEFFDYWWTEKHDDARRRFIERLKNRLEAEGLRCAVVTEANVPTGHFDVMIENGKHNVVRIADRKGGKRLAVELKTGSKISIEQIARYLPECDVLVLVRLKTGHVVKLYSAELEEFLCNDLCDLMAKMKRILNGQAILVRGNSCVGCPVKCIFAEPPTSRMEPRLVVLDNDAFTSDLLHLLHNVYDTIERAVTFVVEELRTPEAEHVAQL